MTEKTDKEKTGELTAEEMQLISALEAKGFSLDYYEPQVEIIAVLNEAAKKIEVISEKARKMRGSDYPEWFDPLDTYKFKDLLETYVREYNDSVKKYVTEQFKNVAIDERELSEFLRKQKKFDPRAIVLHIAGKYGKNEELASLRNIQKNAKDALPPIRGDHGQWCGNMQKFEELVRRGNTGIVFRVYTENEIAGVSKLAEIVVNGVLPSKAVGWVRSAATRWLPPEAGQRFQSTGYTMEWYKTNNNLLIKFASKEIADKFGKAIFTEPEELMKTLFGEAETHAE